MRVVIQRVSHASVTVENKITGKIGNGLLILAGFEPSDSTEDIKWIVSKIARLRIFPDENNIMNLSVIDVYGELLAVSQFTLHASTKKGNRPSYIRAAHPDIASQFYDDFVNLLEKETNIKVQTGIFGAMMKVELLNDGPVTIIIDSKNKEF